MDIKNQNIKILPYMAFGDALGFLRENTKSNNLQSFIYDYSPNIKLLAPKGQWSYITQLMLINIKCFVDKKEKLQVEVDYKRMIEELKLWKYYRCGNPTNFIKRIELGNKYYKDDFYWNDERGYGFSRIMPIVLANKNFSSIEMEVYKNIIYVNRHPQIIITGLILARLIHLLLMNGNLEKSKLIDELKSYLINLKLIDLEEAIETELPNSYKIKFEQEKINYIIDLDKIDSIEEINTYTRNSKNVLLASINIFLTMYIGDGSIIDLWSNDQKEVFAIAYGLLALVKKIDIQQINEIKDINFIESMGEYIIRLREYKINRGNFKKTDYMVDVFKLNKGEMVKHPLLNPIVIKDKNEKEDYVEVMVEAKSGELRFIKKKTKTV